MKKIWQRYIEYDYIPKPVYRFWKLNISIVFVASVVLFVKYAIAHIELIKEESFLYLTVFMVLYTISLVNHRYKIISEPWRAMLIFRDIISPFFALFFIKFHDSSLIETMFKDKSNMIMVWLCVSLIIHSLMCIKRVVKNQMY